MNITPPVAPVASGAFQGASGVAVIGATQASVQPGWGTPSFAGNIRVIEVQSPGDTAPTVSIQDPDGIVYTVSSTPVTYSLKAPVLPGSGQTISATTTTALVGTTLVSRDNVNSQPPIIVNFTGISDTAPVTVIVYEWLAASAG